MNLWIKSCQIILRILKYWECCAIDVDGLSGGLVASWNPSTCSFKPYGACAGIMLEGKSLGFEKPLHLLNTYAPYKERKQL